MWGNWPGSSHNASRSASGRTPRGRRGAVQAASGLWPHVAGPWSVVRAVPGIRGRRVRDRAASRGGRHLGSRPGLSSVRTCRVGDPRACRGGSRRRTAVGGDRAAGRLERVRRAPRCQLRGCRRRDVRGRGGCRLRRLLARLVGEAAGRRRRTRVPGRPRVHRLCPDQHGGPDVHGGRRVRRRHRRELERGLRPARADRRRRMAQLPSS